MHIKPWSSSVKCQSMSFGTIIKFLWFPKSDHQGFSGSCVLKVVSAKYRPIYRPICWSILGRVSTDTIGRYLAEYRPSVGRVSTDISVDISVDGISVNCRWHIGQLSVVYRCDVGGTGEINKD